MIRKAFVFILPLALVACSVGPDYQEPKNSFLDRWFAPKTPHVSDDAAILEWWTVFDDPLLDKYIHQAVENNKDVKISLANLRAARARRQQETASLLPSVGASGGAGRSQGSDNLSSTGEGQAHNLFEGGFDASWELDIFGGNRRSVEAADARIGSATASYEDVLLSVLSEVARNYYDARGLQKRVAITEQSSQLLEKTLELISARRKAGEASEFDLSRAQGEYQLTRAKIPNIKAEFHASVYTLSVLLGLPPEALLDEMQAIKPLPAPPDVVPVGLRSDILRRRPDVRIAERDLAASVADIGVETSDLFPKFFLTGSAGSEARMFGDLFRAAGGTWSLGSLIQWPVFEGGAIRARIAEKRAQSDAAMASYEKAVLSALADAETSLARYGQELETRKLLEDGVQSRRKSVALAQELFNAGEEDFLAVLDAERELTASEDSLVISETQSITKLISLYTALGGGWQVFAQDPVAKQVAPEKTAPDLKAPQQDEPTQKQSGPEDKKAEDPPAYPAKETTEPPEPARKHGKTTINPQPAIAP